MSEARPVTQLFVPGSNCWRVGKATRAAYLVDADVYFKAFVAAASQARRSLLITGWDFHSRTRLLCGEQPDHCETELGSFLNGLTKRNRNLEINILTWDYPMIFGSDREWAPIYGFGWQPRRRVHFRYDNTHPVGGSHHQKLVVVDDAVAFCGGIDLTCRRWDTSCHAADDVHRVVQGTPYPPFHDLMMVVEGDAARSLGELVRERWRKATGERLSPPPQPVSEPEKTSWRRRLLRKSARQPTTVSAWPEFLDGSEYQVVTDVDVAIARTSPPDEQTPAVREVEKLYIDMIAAARRCIYIENQYFTADSIGEALAARLQEPDGPEIILVLRQLSHGWLEELTMQTLRTRLIRRLREVDRYGHLHVYFPFIGGLKDGTCIDVHSKLMIVDDEFVRIGSSNIANRSMGLDTECDLAIRSDGRKDLRKAAQGLRAQLLGEHLGSQPAAVQVAIERSGSVHAAIESLSNPQRTLQPLTELPDVSDAVLNVVSVADPERPVALQDLVKLFRADAEPQRRATAGWKKIAIAVAVVTLLTGLWKFTPLAELLEPQRITDWAREFGSKPWAPLVVLLAYTPACVVMFPRSVITLFAVVAFGPWLGFACAMAGIEISAWLSYVLGQTMNRGVVQRMAGDKLNPIIDVLRRRGLIAMTALRLVPLAPFVVEGIVAGAVRIKLWHFMVGTGIGMLPGTLAATVFGGQIDAMLGSGQVNYWMITGVVVFMIFAAWLVRRWLMNSAAPRPAGTSHEASRPGIA